MPEQEPINPHPDAIEADQLAWILSVWLDYIVEGPGRWPADEAFDVVLEVIRAAEATGMVRGRVRLVSPDDLRARINKKNTA